MRVELVGQVAHQVAEVDALRRREVERDLAAVEVIFPGDHLHIKASIQGLELGAA